jgi:uncharacterized protein (TIGR02145 family)
MKKIITTLAVIGVLAMSCKKDKKAPPTDPVVTTAAVTNITINSATGGGSIVSDGGAAVTKSGVVWSLTNNTPTLRDSVVAGTTANGTFTSNITGLDFNRTYYVRAFAINSVDTAYGNAVSFTTVVDTNKVRFTYNGQEVVYGTIISPTTGKKWLDRNIGAKQAATAFNDYLACGDLFQWGRPADGHQLITWTSSTAGSLVNGGITATKATSDNPGHSNFIIAPDPSDFAGDWRSDNNSNRWATTPRGPCPEGWHVPTRDESRAEIAISKGGTATSGGIIDYTTGYNLLKLTTPGFIAGVGTTDPAPGQFWRNGERGYYWCSSDILNGGVTKAYAFSVTVSNAQIPQNPKSYGYSVRCIKD